MNALLLAGAVILAVLCIVAVWLSGPAPEVR